MNRTAVVPVLLAGVATVLVLAVLVLRPFDKEPTIRIGPGESGIPIGESENGDQATVPQGGRSPQVRPEEVGGPGQIPTEGRNYNQQKRVAATILDVRSLQPVAAQVSWGSVRALTDSTGFVELIANGERLPSHVTVSADGFEPRTHDLGVSQFTDFDLGQVLLTPNRNLTVMVKAQHGPPVEGAVVSVASSTPTSPLPRAFFAGSTDSDGKLALRASDGELIIVGDLESGMTAVASIEAGKDFVEVVLENSPQATRWLGVRDSRSGMPIAGLSVVLTSTKGLPSLKWAGETGPDGLIPLPLPPFEVEVRTEPPIQLERQPNNFSTVAAVNLEDETGLGGHIHWINASAAEGAWVRFVSSGSGGPIQNAVAHYYRSVESQDGGYQEFRLRSTMLSNCMLDLRPCLEDGPEPMYVIVSAAGFEPFDSRDARSMAVIGQIIDVEMRPASLGAIQFIGLETGVLAREGHAPGICSLWLFGTDAFGQGIRLRPDAAGLVTDVPDLSQPMSICLSSSPTTAFAELQPRDIHLDPPIEVIVPPRSTISVTFNPGDIPSDDLRALSSLGQEYQPNLLEGKAVFGCLPAGRYVVGTAPQLMASRWKREREPEVGYPLVLEAGADLQLMADDSWRDIPLNSEPIRSQVTLQGPSRAFVVALFEDPGSDHFITAPQLLYPVDSTGRFSFPRRADIMSLAVGTSDRQQGTFIPLAIFDPSRLDVVVKGANLILTAAADVNTITIVELRLDPQEFNAKMQLSRGLIPGEGPADFGWIPLGTHSIGPVGSPLSKVVVNKPGLLRLILQSNGAVSIEE